MTDERDEYPDAGERSATCFEHEITKLKQQRDDLLTACVTANKYINSDLFCGNPRCTICPKIKADKKVVEKAIAKVRE